MLAKAAGNESAKVRFAKMKQAAVKVKTSQAVGIAVPSLTAGRLGKDGHAHELIEIE